MDLSRGFARKIVSVGYCDAVSGVSIEKVLYRD